MLGTLLTVALATAYATWVLTRSELPPVKRARDWVRNRYGPDSLVAYLSNCAWCAGFWVAGVTVGLTVLLSDLPLPGLVWPASAIVTGLVVTASDALANRIALDDLTLESLRDHTR